LIHVGIRAVSAGLALAVGFTAGFIGTRGIGQANAGLPGVLSVFGTLGPDAAVRPPAFETAAINRSGMQLASLESNIVYEPPLDASPADPRTSFEQRFVEDARLASFDERFDAGGLLPVSVPVRSVAIEQGSNSRLTPPNVAGRAIAKAETAKAEAAKSEAAKSASAQGASAPPKRIRTADLSQDLSSILKPANRTAVYDIVAHTVYLPNGRRLEAHSGLGGHMDDPRSINVKARGPTPPNVYDLTLREELFHGVRAIRLNPVDEGKMYGRDGILAHTYMLGPNGQSNGCVSFADYQAFLNAYLNGEINRLVVVEHIAGGPGSETAGGTFFDSLKDFFGRS
jgi:hypothetical protein